MATILEEYVTKAGDSVQQLSAAVNGQKALKTMEDAVRPQATKEVETYLRNNAEGYTYAHKGNLPWKGGNVTVKHVISYTWDNYRKPQGMDADLEAKVDMALNTRLFRKQLLDSAQESADIANASLRAARNNFKASEQALAKLLPCSKCIKDELQIAIP